MCLCKSRKLTDDEIMLIKLSITENNEYLDDLYIYINTPILNSLCNCCRKSSKSAITINKTIYFSFDPDINNNVDLELLLHELKHVEQCKQYGYCCLIPRYIYEVCKYGCNGMYTTEGTLEYEAEQFARLGLQKKI